MSEVFTVRPPLVISVESVWMFGRKDIQLEVKKINIFHEITNWLRSTAEA